MHEPLRRVILESDEVYLFMGEEMGCLNIADPTRAGLNPTPKEPSCVFTRITDSSYLRIRARSYPIFERMCSKLRYDGSYDNLNIAEYYAGLRCLFGEPGSLYDSWEGTFSYSFKMDVFRGGQTYHYLLKITHCKSRVEFGYKKIVENPQVCDPFSFDVYHTPLDKEFSQKDMEYVEVYLYGYIEGYIRLAKERHFLNIPDFVIAVESNQIISGYIDDEFFQRYIEYDDEVDESAVDYGDGQEESDSKLEKVENRFQVEMKPFQSLVSFPVVDWSGDSDPPCQLIVELKSPDC